MVVCAFFVMSPHFVVASLTSGLCNPCNILDAKNCMKVGDCAVLDSTGASVSKQQASEQEYLNLISPVIPPDTKGTEGKTNNSDETEDKNQNKG